MTFNGWEPPKRNYSKLPHQFIGSLPEFSSLSEMCVVIYVLRHTWGFDDEYKKITMDEFRNGRKLKDGTRIDNGTGLSLNAIRNGIKKAVEHGFLFVTEDNSDKARIKRYYSLTEFGGSTSEPLNVNSRGSTSEPHRSDHEPRTEKETNRKIIQKEKELPLFQIGNVEQSDISQNGTHPKEEGTADLSASLSRKSLDSIEAEILAAWGNLFPDKRQPRAGTHRAEIKKLWENEPEFQEKWLEAMECAAASPTCQRSGWFQFAFFVKTTGKNGNKKYLNYQKCLDRWVSGFDAKLENPHTNGRSSSISTPKEMDYDKTPDGAPTRFMTAANFNEFAEGISAQ